MSVTHILLTNSSGTFDLSKLDFFVTALLNRDVLPKVCAPTYPFHSSPCFLFVLSASLPIHVLFLCGFFVSLCSSLCSPCLLCYVTLSGECGDEQGLCPARRGSQCCCDWRNWLLYFGCRHRPASATAAPRALKFDHAVSRLLLHSSNLTSLQSPSFPCTELLGHRKRSISSFRSPAAVSSLTQLLPGQFTYWEHAGQAVVLWTRPTPLVPDHHRVDEETAAE
jgi:hypothetical protein